MGDVTRAACILALCVSCAPAAAETPSDRWHNGLQSYAEIVPSNEGNCVAEIIINNYPTDHVPAAVGSLYLGDLHVGIAYQLNVGPLASERYTIRPPDGYIAIPMELDVMDGDAGSVLICHYVGF